MIPTESTIPITPETRYQQGLNNDGFAPDPAQAEAVRHLQALYENLSSHRASYNLPLFKWFTTNNKPLQGLYLWGGVGRGKTWLMDLFYDCLPFDTKIRMHFHHFMKHIHEELNSLSGQKDPLKHIAKRLASKAKVICFDEFFVSDITDAMILGGLLEQLFKNGVTLVATSNVVPDELYKDGLQRARFLPAIELLNKHTAVINVDGGTDYRLRILQQAKTYYCPLDESAHKQLLQTFHQLSPDPAHIQENASITIEGRTIDYISRSDGVGYFSFGALCDGPRSQNDYIELACLFHTILLEGLPQLRETEDDQARRFISLVDEFYDRNVSLIISAAVPIPDIYTGSRLAFEFQRTASRLHEMQSEDYLARPHIAG